MRALAKEIGYFIKRAWFSMPLLACWLIGFSYSVLHPAVGVDDLALPRYLADGLYVRMQRPGGYIVMWLLEKLKCGEHAQAFLIAVFMLLAAVLLCVLFRRASRDRLPFACYSVFACLFAAFPLAVEIFAYANAGIEVALGFALIAGILLYCQSRLNRESRRKNLPGILLMILLLAFTVSMYQAILTVYVCCVGALLTVEHLYGDPKPFRTLIMDGIKYAGLLLAAILVMALSSKLILACMDAEPYLLQTQTSVWLREGIDVFACLRDLGRYIVRWMLVPALFYEPLAAVWLAMFLSALLCIAAIRQKRAGAVLPIAVMTVSLVLIPLAQGFFIGYRVLLAAGPYVAAVLMLTAAWAFRLKRGKIIGNAVTAAALVLALFHAGVLHGVFRLDDLRWQEEKQVALSCYSELKAEGDLSKPVIFVGEYALSEGIVTPCTLTIESPLYRKFYNRLLFLDDSAPLIECPINSVLTWGVKAFSEPNTELIRIYRYLGCEDVRQGSREQYEEAKSIAEDMPSYPAEGYIRDAGDFTVVRLGEQD